MEPTREPIQREKRKDRKERNVVAGMGGKRKGEKGGESDNKKLSHIRI